MVFPIQRHSERLLLRLMLCRWNGGFSAFQITFLLTVLGSACTNIHLGGTRHSSWNDYRLQQRSTANVKPRLPNIKLTILKALRIHPTDTQCFLVPDSSPLSYPLCKALREKHSKLNIRKLLLAAVGSHLNTINGVREAKCNSIHKMHRAF